MNKIKREFISDIYYYQEGPGVRKWQFKDKGVKLLNVGNINNKKLNLDTTNIYISEEEAYGKYNHFLIDEGDLVIACSGIHVDNFHNKITFISKNDLPLCLNTSTMRFKILKSKEGDLNYLNYFLQTNDFKSQLGKLITGSAQLNFGPSHIQKITIPLPPLPQQKVIADQLDKAQELVQYNEQLIEKYDELQQSLFLDMFGDPVINEKGWEKKELNKFGNIKTGNTPSRNNEENYNEKAIEWIKTNNILETEIFVSIADEYLSTIGKEKGRIVKSGSLLVACIAGSIDSIGRSALTNREVAFNQQINAIEPNTKVNPKFLYYLFVNSKKYIQNHTTSGMKKMLSKGEFEKIRMILPPLSLQTEFASHIESIELQKEQAKEALAKSKDIFQGLLQEYFM